MRVKILERREMTINMDDPDGEFGRVHPLRRSWEVYAMGGYDPLKTFSSYRSAEAWAKRNKYAIAEVG